MSVNIPSGYGTITADSSPQSFAAVVAAANAAAVSQSTITYSYEYGVFVVPSAVVSAYVAPSGGGLTPTVPASTVAQANVSGRPVNVYVSGGTVTVIKVNGTTTGLTSGQFRLKVNGTIAITYSAAPTWVWIQD